ncbi:hypothetical protein V7128_01775 [Neobacillus vireti]
MKTFEIQGKLIVHDDQTHQEMLEKLYGLLLSSNMYFQGETKEHKDN